MTQSSPTAPRRHPAGKKTSESVVYRVISHRQVSAEGLRMERGFYFGVVENGTARIVDNIEEREIGAGDLVILSPGCSCTLRDASPEFTMIRIAMQPYFFDTLPEGQTMYSQLSKRAEGARPTLLHPAPEAFSHLRATAALFSEAMEPFESCRRGIILHWCGLFLLQLAEILHAGLAETPLSIRRADRLFRRFKQLSIEHFRAHHDIAFYADRLSISATYLSRIVKRTTGHTVFAHLAGLLCAEAKKELERSDRQIKEIADRLGFADQSSFGKFFKAQTGLSPNHYRQRAGMQ